MFLFFSFQARSETEVQSEKTWMDAERVWLVHKGGFAAASQLKGEGYGLPEGRVKIRLDHGGEILEVDEDDVEKVSSWDGNMMFHEGTVLLYTLDQIKVSNAL